MHKLRQLNCEGCQQFQSMAATIALGDDPQAEPRRRAALTPQQREDEDFSPRKTSVWYIAAKSNEN